MFGWSFVIVTLFLFVLGTGVGSFLNVFIYRTINDEPWMWGRSKCEHCRKKIAWFDNIPLFSYFMLRAKCRYCRQPISMIHPTVEFLTGTLFVWWYWGGAFFFKLTQAPLTTLQPLFWLLVGVLLLVIFVADWLFMVIPDLAVFSLLGLIIIYRLGLVLLGIMKLQDLMMTIIVATVFTLFFWFLWWVTKGKGFGLGDVKLMLPLGLLLGWPRSLVGVFFAFILGAVTGIMLILIRKKKIGQVIPFGPFLVVGGVIGLVWGEIISSWYFNLFL